MEGRIGKRLASWSGLSFEEYLEAFDRMNLLTVRQDTREKGFEFDHEAARVVAAGMVFVRGQRVVLLGRRVARAFALTEVYYFPQRLGEADAYVVPHPSGVNRYFNDPANVKRMEEFMHDILRRRR